MPSTPDRPGNDARMTRRDFNIRAAAAAGMLLAGAAGLSAASAQTTETPAEKPPAPPAPVTPEKPEKPVTPPPAAAAAKPTPGLDEAVALCLLTAPHLPAKDHTELAAQVKGTLDLVKELRSHKIADGTEPDFVFRALLPTAKPAARPAATKKPASERKARRGR